MFATRMTLRAAVAGAFLVLVASGATQAQDAAPAPGNVIPQSHIDAALRAADAAPNVGDFDALLPFISEQVQNRLIRVRPDLFREIAEVVEEQAIEMSGRSNGLRARIAQVWASAFTEEELGEIAAFFGSELGAKYKELLPVVGERVLQASRDWTNRISEDLFQASMQAMRDRGHAL